jgi:hypothetical protein
MAEQVKVFNNVNDVTPSVGQLEGTTALDITIVTTSASERAVIKDVAFSVEGDGKARCTPTLDLDGFTTNTGTAGELSVEGNLIVGPSSTLKIKANTTVNTSYAGEFQGMVFFEGSSGCQYLTGTGTGSPTSLTNSRLSSSNFQSDDAVAAIPPTGAPGGGDGNEIYFYRTHNNAIRKYKYNSSSHVSGPWTHGSTGYSITADDEYLYRAGSQSTTNIWTTKLSDHSYGTITTSTAYQGPQANQGGYFFYHKPTEQFFSKREGGYDNIWIISKDGQTVTNPQDSGFAVGSYSDGACIVTPATGPRAGKSFIIEQGTSYWYYYDISTGTVTRTANGTNGSTEYAQGGGEIAPGVALIFSELSDQVARIDMNPATPTWSFGSATAYLTGSPAFGNRFGFADYLRPAQSFTYSALTTGIEIT